MLCAYNEQRVHLVTSFYKQDDSLFGNRAMIRTQREDHLINITSNAVASLADGIV